MLDKSFIFSLQTTLPAFHSKTFSVRRRFSDFLGLYEKLAVKHNLLGCIIPPPPQKSVVGKPFHLNLTLTSLGTMHSQIGGVFLLK